MNEPIKTEGILAPANHSFDAINKFVNASPEYEELQWAMLGMASASTMEMVIEFHNAFRINLEKRKGTSHKFMAEELQEFLEAKNDVERLDALCDIQYFLDGSFHAYGWEKIKDKAMKEIHRSNMSKMGADGKPIIRADGKIIKGANYSKPELEQFI